MGKFEIKNYRVFLVHGNLARQIAEQSLNGAGANLRGVLERLSEMEGEGVRVVSLEGVGGLKNIRVRRGEKVALAGPVRDICFERIRKSLERRGAVVSIDPGLVWEEL